MYLSKEEEHMLRGDYGEAVEISMSILTKLGDMYQADRMIKISQVHIDAASYGGIYDAGLDMVERFAGEGAVFQVPTTLNSSGIDFERWRELLIPPSFAEKQIRLADAYLKLGAIPTWTCAPYQYGEPVRPGQFIAWGESNAVAYANSVIGARTNRYADLIDVCTAIAGRVPRFGLYLDENRHGQILFKICIDTKNFTCFDYASLGYYVGSISGSKVPVLQGISKSVTPDQLKSFCAAIATSGAVGLFHLCGITPEARNIEEAFGGMKPIEKIRVGAEELNETKNRLCTMSGKCDLVLLGCPHYSIEQIGKVARRLHGKKIRRNMELWIFTNGIIKRLSDRIGYTQIIESAGGKIISDACFLSTHQDVWRFESILTDSAKMAHYAPGICNIDVRFENAMRCVDEAVE